MKAHRQRDKPGHRGETYGGDVTIYIVCNHHTQSETKNMKEKTTNEQPTQEDLREQIEGFIKDLKRWRQQVRKFKKGTWAELDTNALCAAGEFACFSEEEIIALAMPAFAKCSNLAEMQEVCNQMAHALNLVEYMRERN